MSGSIPDAIREAVIDRAQGKCEYCGKPQVSFFAHEVDHVIALKHRGKTTLDNLAFSCHQCNRFKGSDIASLDPETDALPPLFNPRTQVWIEHFQHQLGQIVPLTPEGRVTEFLLRFNEETRVQERISLKIGM